MASSISQVSQKRTKGLQSEMFQGYPIPVFPHRNCNSTVVYWPSYSHWLVRQHESNTRCRSRMLVSRLHPYCLTALGKAKDIHPHHLRKARQLYSEIHQASSLQSYSLEFIIILTQYFTESISILNEDFMQYTKKQGAQYQGSFLHLSPIPLLNVF